MRVIIVSLLALLVTACSSPEPKIYDDMIEFPEYQVGAGDTLYINVWKNPDLSISVPVRPDGYFSAPLVGEQRAEGLTINQITSDLSVKYAKYLRTPRVTVIVTNAQSGQFLNRVRITGAVNQPQSVPYSRGMTVLDLVLFAGGMTPYANGDSAVLHRKTPFGMSKYKVDVEAIIDDGEMKTNYELRPSDVIIIPESIF